MLWFLGGTVMVEGMSRFYAAVFVNLVWVFFFLMCWKKGCCKLQNCNLNSSLKLLL